jgi:histidine ammonia-lyase
MGATAAYKLQTIRENAVYVFAIELLHAIQAINLRKDLELSATTKEIVDEFRKCVPFLEHDRVLSDDIARAVDFFHIHKRQWITRYDVQ